MQIDRRTRSTVVFAGLLLATSIGCKCMSHDTSNFDPKLGIQPLFSPPLTEHETATLQETVKFPLPDDFTRFLLRWNGCKFRGLPVVKIARSSKSFAQVKTLYGLSQTPTMDDLRYAGNAYEFNQRVPEELFAIGENPYRQKIAMSLGSSDRGCVYLWAPGEDWEEENVRTRDYLTLLAPSFSEFYQRLELNPDPKYHDWPV